MIWLFACVFLCACVGWFGAWLLRHHAEHIGLISDPNHRSSHTIPTPHGGGVGIMLAGVLSFLGLYFILPHTLPDAMWWCAGGAGFAGAVLSLVDDLKHVPAGIRFVCHLLLSALIVYAVYPLEPMNLYLFNISGILLAVLVSGVLLWWTNLFNFMDGIDGIAGMQAVFMLLAGAGLVMWKNNLFGNDPVFWLCLNMTAGVVGFLLLNWPPAKIFMGDIGSIFLALLLAFVTLYTIRMGWAGYYTWVILGASFIVDATVMLCLRVIRRERLHEAHRNHAYQRLSRRWMAHQPVTLLYLGVNVLWLLPLAFLSAAYPLYGWLCVLSACLPLVAGCLWVQKRLP